MKIKNSSAKYFSVIFYSILFFVSLNTYTLKAQLYSFETKDLRLIHFGKIHSYMVPHVASCFQNSLNFYSKLFDYTPTERVTVLLHDFNDYGNAGATAVPRNRISVAMSPYNFVYETVPANERINSTMIHELVHIVANDKASDSDNFFRSIFFGKVSPDSENPISTLYGYLTTPRRYAPRWFHEGIAVFLETWLSGGYGRVLGSYDEMVFRTMVRDSVRIYDLLGLESEGTKIDFQVGVNSYLYGTRFMSYLALKYGPESLIEWTDRVDNSKSYFVDQFHKVYRISIYDAWSNWIEFEKEFQKENLKVIGINPITQNHLISNRALGSLSRAYYNSTDNNIYMAVYYPGQVPHIASLYITSDEIESLQEIKGAALYYVTSLVYNKSLGKIFYTTDNNDWRDLNSINLKTGEAETLIKDIRVGDLAFNPADSSIWSMRHYNGLSTVVKIPFPYKDWNSVYTWPYGKDIYDLDISPDGKSMVASLVEISGRQSLVKINLESFKSGEPDFKELYDFDPSIPSNFIFSNDGNYLFGSSYMTGVSNIWRYDLKSEKMEILTNCETGLFRPTEYKPDSLIAFEYTGEGFVPIIIENRPITNVKRIEFLGQRIVEEHPIVLKWIAESPASIKIDSLVTYSGDYNGLTNMGVASIYPIVEGYKEFPAYGMKFNFSDPVGFYNFNFSATYSPNSLIPDNEKWHLKANYEYMNWKLFAKYNFADFYDLFGPTKVSRKGYSFGGQFNNTLLYDKPKTIDYTVSLAGYWDLERLPDYQNIGVSYNKFLKGSICFNYNYLRASLGAVDYEKGFKWNLVSNATYVRKKIFPRIINNFDIGFPLPIDHSSIWIRSSLGYSFGKRNETFANFYFGGFGNNWIDYQHEKRYRDYYGFPGLELNELAGINYGKIITEWNLPPLRFRQIGFPSLYITWARTALFSSVILTNFDKSNHIQKVLNAGAQLDFKIIMLSHLNLTLSFGYAQAFREQYKPSNEFMISLKIL